MIVPSKRWAPALLNNFIKACRGLILCTIILLTVCGHTCIYGIQLHMPWSEQIVLSKVHGSAIWIFVKICCGLCSTCVWTAANKLWWTFKGCCTTLFIKLITLGHSSTLTILFWRYYPYLPKRRFVPVALVANLLASAKLKIFFPVIFLLRKGMYRVLNSPRVVLP